MPRSRRPEELANNASRLHRRVGEILTSGIFSTWEVRQEYPVNQVNKLFRSGRERFDWVILSPVNVVIEIHGQQHERKVCFGGIDGDTAKRNFRKRLEGDDKKEKAAKDAGWGYLVIWYYEKDITEEELMDKILLSVQESKPQVNVCAKQKPSIPKPKEYNWPKGKKIPGRKFNGEPIITH